MTMKNQEIRNAARDAGVHLWQLAELERVSEWTFCRRLRHELPEDDKLRIMGHIARLAEQKETR